MARTTTPFGGRCGAAAGGELFRARVRQSAQPFDLQLLPLPLLLLHRASPLPPASTGNDGMDPFTAAGAKDLEPRLARVLDLRVHDLATSATPPAGAEPRGAGCEDAGAPSCVLFETGTGIRNGRPSGSPPVQPKASEFWTGGLQTPRRPPVFGQNSRLQRRRSGFDRTE